MALLNRDELLKMGFKSVGENVLISDKASFYSADKMTIGSNVRIDDFCILSGNVSIGCNIHIAAYSAFYGANAGITVEDFANISSRVTVYAVSDDYSGETMSNPMVPDCFKNVTELPVRIGRHVIIGATSVVLPGVTIGQGASFGAFSLINKDVEEWTINAGIPTKVLKKRSKNLLELEKEFYKGAQNGNCGS